MGGEVGEFDQVAVAAFEDVKSEAVFAGIGDQGAVDLADAQIITYLIMAGAQDDGNHFDFITVWSSTGRTQESREGVKADFSGDPHA